MSDNAVREIAKYLLGFFTASLIWMVSYDEPIQTEYIIVDCRMFKNNNDIPSQVKEICKSYDKLYDYHEEYHSKPLTKT